MKKQIQVDYLIENMFHILSIQSNHHFVFNVFYLLAIGYTKNKNIVVFLNNTKCFPTLYQLLLISV